MPTSRTRARDDDRDALCKALDAAFAEGQLDGAEHRERTAAALRAKTVGELRRLVEDLQLGTRMPQRIAEPSRPQQARRRSRWVGALATAALLTVGFAVGRASVPAPAETTDNAPVGGAEQVEARVVGLTGLHTPDGLVRFVADVRTRLGGTRVVGAVVYPEYAVVTTAAPGAPSRTQRWTYRGGLAGPETGTSRDPDEPLVDLAVFDPATVLALLAGAPESLKVADATSRYLIFEDDGSGPHVAVYASNEYHESGYLQARPDGSIISVHPYQPR